MRRLKLVIFVCVLAGMSIVISCATSTPYSFNEKIAWLTNNLFGPSTKYKELTPFIPETTTLNEITPKVTIAFLGDIMMIPGKRLTFSNDLKQFFSRADYLVGNFEGTITSLSRGLLGSKHSEQILTDLKALFPPEKTILTNANNHTCDYPKQELDRSVQLQKQHGFIPIGLKQQPTVLLNNKINVASVTKWSNKPCPYLAEFDDSDSTYNKQAEFNLLAPHWGYEMQLYPNPEQINKSKSLLSRWDMIVGHHSHIPQVITSYRVNNTNKLVAYSLGDFCTFARPDKYLYGIVVLAEIGPDVNGIWQVGKIEWRFSYVNHLDNKTIRVELTDGFKYSELPLKDFPDSDD